MDECQSDRWIQRHVNCRCFVVQKEPKKMSDTEKAVENECQRQAHFLICEFANGHRNCACRNGDKKRPCESVGRVVKTVFNLARYNE